MSNNPVSGQPNDANRAQNPQRPAAHATNKPADPTLPPAPRSVEGGLQLNIGAHPLPDYQLLYQLGKGGFGEVWKATGPGGYLLALKFVRLADRGSSSELRALDLMKNIRHPHLLGLFGAWQVDGYLIVAMELGDRTLMDRLKEAQRDGLPGIPRHELLEYMSEAARGIDHLNNLNIQHRDIKPQNLLIVGGGVKVADFGLAKLLETTIASNTGAVTPAYAAPEFLQGETCPQSDQYALAVTYCHLRGGRLPFTGNAAQVMTGHLKEPPDLTMLPEVERSIVGRALAKQPTTRWPSCRAFVDALRKPSSGSFPSIKPKSGELIPQPTGPRSSERTKTAPGPPPLPKPTQPPHRPWRVPLSVVLLILASILFLVIVVVITYLAGRNQPRQAPALRLGEVPAVTLRQGQSKTIALEVKRSHCQGPVTVTLEGLPAGVKVQESVVLDGPSGQMRLSASEDAAVGQAEVKVVARLNDLSARTVFTLEVKRSARPPGGFANSIGMEFVPIRPGSFRMGSRPGEAGRALDESQHDVEITRAFFLGAFEVTQGQYEAVMKKNPSHFTAANGGGPDHPVDNVSWEDADAFCKALTELDAERKAGRVYRLPTEAEWEYACRAGKTTPFHFGDVLSLELANFRDVDGKERATKPVGSSDKANDWGLFDMHGNVWEWCQDWYDPGYYRSGPVVGLWRDPPGPAKGTQRVLRGGSYDSPATHCRSAHRDNRAPTERNHTFGFRVACTSR
jgi:formylglycine-generating enzyme required for sulfatase activity/serine/threonine protein kinase